MSESLLYPVSSKRNKRNRNNLQAAGKKGKLETVSPFFLSGRNGKWYNSKRDEEERRGSYYGSQRADK